MTASHRSTFANLTSSSSNSLSSRRLSTSQSVYTNLGQDPFSQPSPPEHPGITPKARALRRAARAALVDAYRRFVLTELTRRLPGFSSRDASGNYQGVYGGGFCVWILHSMRRRAQERIDQLFEEAHAEQAYDRRVSLTEVQQVLEQNPGNPKVIPHRMEATMTIVSPTFDGDEDETATDTDGSSLHTPSSCSHFNQFLVRPPTSASSHSRALSSSDIQDECQPGQELDSPFPTTPSSSPSPPTSPTLPSSPSSPTFLDSPSSPTTPSPIPIFPSRPTSSTLSQDLTGNALLEYNDLMDLRERLLQLAIFADSQNRIAAEEMRSRLEVLTVRSRRRAWSTGAFRVGCGGRARSCQAFVGFSLQSQYGFAMPFKSSPLARFSWTAEDLEKEDQMELEIASTRDFVSANLSQDELETIEDEEAEDNRPLVDGEFELYEEFPGPSPLDLRGRRGRRNHRRRKNMLDMGMSGSMHRLFPVSEELEGEGEEAVDLEFRVALGGGIAGYGLVRGRRLERKGRTFMGCDEVPVECDEDEGKLGRSQETLVDEVDDGLVDPRELDIELGFGFDFHQKGGGRGFLGHTDDDDLFDQDDDEDDDDDDEDEDEFKFDLSSQLERPKIRPRVRSNSIFMPKDVFGQPMKHRMTSRLFSQPLNFASSSHNLPFYTPLSKSTPSVFPPRSVRTATTQLSNNHPVLDISRTTTPSVPCEPELAEIEIRLVDEQSAGPYSSTHLLNSRHQKQESADIWRSVTTNADAMKSLPAAPLPKHVPLEIGVHDEGPEEFTLSMDLPRAAAGGGNGGGTGKKRMRHPPVGQASPGRSMRLFGDVHGSFVSPC